MGSKTPITQESSSILWVNSFFRISDFPIFAV